MVPHCSSYCFLANFVAQYYGCTFRTHTDKGKEMLISQSDDPLLMKLRDAIVKALITSDLDQDERAAIAFSYWDTVVRSYIGSGDFQGSWWRIKAAALGEKVFEGPNRVCRPNLEGEPVGLVCAPREIMGFIHVLYYAMHQAKIELDHDNQTPAWGAMFQPGARTAGLMRGQSGISFEIAAQMAEVIDYWASNHSRIAVAA